MAPQLTHSRPSEGGQGETAGLPDGQGHGREPAGRRRPGSGRPQPGLPRGATFSSSPGQEEGSGGGFPPRRRGVQRVALRPKLHLQNPLSKEGKQGRREEWGQGPRDSRRDNERVFTANFAEGRAVAGVAPLDLARPGRALAHFLVLPFFYLPLFPQLCLPPPDSQPSAPTLLLFSKQGNSFFLPNFPLFR